MKKTFLISNTGSAQTKRAHGDQYEDRAEAYLKANGYVVRERNVNYPYGEIDLVAELFLPKEKLLVFVEVRKRDPRSWIRAEQTLTYPKQRRLRNAIERYLIKYRGEANCVRIDLIAFQGDEIKHYPHFMTV